MARRRQGGLDVIAAMPWPVGIVLGVLAYLTIRFGIAVYFSASDSVLLQGVGQQAASGMLEPLAWMVLGLCWIGAAASYFRSRHRKKLLHAQTGLDSITALSWQKFEMLVGEAFRNRGYSVEESGLGGADGGVDLILRKDGRTELVQCKQWRNKQVKPSVIREMWGLREHHRADAVKIVCVGDYTRDAKAFADGKSIELINGVRLLDLVRDGQSGLRHQIQPAAGPAGLAAATTACPVCRGELVPRKNRATGRPFLGCSAYPRCKGTRPA